MTKVIYFIAGCIIGIVLLYVVQTVSWYFVWIPVYETCTGNLKETHDEEKFYKCLEDHSFLSEAVDILRINPMDNIAREILKIN